MTAKTLIAVDIDEVLAHFIPSLANFHNEAFNEGTAPLNAYSFFSYEFHKVLIDNNIILIMGY